ncbi:hypothetical protein CLU84_2668 [Comamonas sp. 26]|nr:hypothetical protein CLU84_2668 [Comamonas sp. 26]
MSLQLKYGISLEIDPNITGVMIAVDGTETRWSTRPAAAIFTEMRSTRRFCINPSEVELPLNPRRSYATTTVCGCAVH